jgi:hypothetical protein
VNDRNERPDSTRHHVTYDDDRKARNSNRWPCYCSSARDHGEDDAHFQSTVLAERHSRARAIFEKRMQFEFTDEYEGSREWSDSVIEAEQ